MTDQINGKLLQNATVTGAKLVDGTIGIAKTDGSILSRQAMVVHMATITTLPSYARVGNVMTASANGVLPNQDGVVPVAGQRILYKNPVEGDEADLGPYDITSIGEASVSPWVLTRCADANTTAKLPQGSTFYVQYGSQHDTTWTMTAQGAVLNTDVLYFDNLQSSAVVTKHIEVEGVAEVTTADGQEAFATALGTAMAADEAPLVFIGGRSVKVGNASKSASCYFSIDAGTTALAWGPTCTSAALLYWVGTYAGYELDTGDTVRIYFAVLA
jgi:hypothetical protein